MSARLPLQLCAGANIHLAGKLQPSPPTDMHDGVLFATFVSLVFSWFMSFFVLCAVTTPAMQVVQNCPAHLCGNLIQRTLRDRVA
jgi:hypothetical protein